MPGHKANQALQQEPAGSNEDPWRQRCAQLEQQLKACTAELTTAYDRLREETHQRQQLDATLGFASCLEALQTQGLSAARTALSRMAMMALIDPNEYGDFKVLAQAKGDGVGTALLGFAHQCP
jgi:hypothetical protein